MGPLARKAFELYASTRHNVETLGEELYHSGLRNRNGGRVTKNGLTTLFNNSFYIGIIWIRKTGERFADNHEPLVSKTLFECVQRVLHGKVNARSKRHDFLFRRLFSCATCRVFAHWRAAEGTRLLSLSQQAVSAGHYSRDNCRKVSFAIFPTIPVQRSREDVFQIANLKAPRNLGNAM